MQFGIAHVRLYWLVFSQFFEMNPPVIVQCRPLIEDNSLVSSNSTIVPLIINWEGYPLSHPPQGYIWYMGSPYLDSLHTPLVFLEPLIEMQLKLTTKKYAQ